MNMPTALALTSALFLCAGSATAGDIDDITKAVTAFAAGADGRDAKAVDGVTDGDFRVVFSVGDGKPAVLSKEAYLGMIKDGKVGGSPRVVRINDVHARDRFASVTETQVRFSGHAP